MDIKSNKDAEIIQTSDQLCKSILHYAEQLKGKDTDQSVVQTLEAVPSVISYFKNKCNVLEQDLQGLVELVTQYKEKVVKDNEKSKSITEKLEAENKTLKAKLLLWEDLMIRMEANQRRKLHLERIKSEVEEEDKSINEVVRSLSQQ